VNADPIPTDDVKENAKFAMALLRQRHTKPWGVVLGMVEVRSLLAYIASLEQTVSRLPETADRVRVGAGSAVYHPAFLNERKGDADFGKPLPLEVEGYLAHRHIGHRFSVSECYCTSEAALAARAVAGDGEGVNK
jgi:hypothetical protein